MRKAHRRNIKKETFPNLVCFSFHLYAIYIYAETLHIEFDLEGADRLLLAFKRGRKGTEVGVGWRGEGGRERDETGIERGGGGGHGCASWAKG